MNLIAHLPLNHGMNLGELERILERALNTAANLNQIMATQKEIITKLGDLTTQATALGDSIQKLVDAGANASPELSAAVDGLGKAIADATAKVPGSTLPNT